MPLKPEIAAVAFQPLRRWSEGLCLGFRLSPRFWGNPAVEFPRSLDFEGADPHIWLMNYLLALLLPPLSIFLAGRPILGIIVVPIWILALIFSGGLTHPMFIFLAWLVIFERRTTTTG